MFTACLVLDLPSDGGPIAGFYFDFSRCLLWLGDDYLPGVIEGLSLLLLAGDYMLLEGDTPGENILALFLL